MDPGTLGLIVTGVFAAFGGGALAFTLRQMHAWQRVQREVAEPLGLKGDAQGFAGMVRGHHVRVTWASKATPGGVKVHVQLDPEAPALRCSPAAERAHPDRVWIGDPTFDAIVQVIGPEPLVRSRMHRDTRARLLGLLDQKVAFDGQRFEWTHARRPDVAWTKAALGTLLDLADLLSAPVRVSSLGDTALNDHPPAALGALKCMPAGAARDAVDAQLLDQEPDGRAIVAALRGAPELRAQRLTRWALMARDDAFRAAALTALAAIEDATDVARRCLDTPLAADVALKLLADADPPVALETLAQLIQDHVAAPTALWVSRRYGQAAEPLHVSCLVHPEPATQHAAADGLAFLGTQAAVKPLRRFAARVGGDAALRDAARGALDAIITRQNAVAGRLAVVDASGGGLSET